MRRGQLSLAAAVVLAIVIGPAGAFAESETAPQQNDAEASDPAALRALIRARAAELEAVNRSIEISESRQRTLNEEVARVESDRDTLQAQLVETADQLQRTEDDIASTRKRLQGLVGSENRLRQSLRRRHGEVVEILAVLQRIGRRPPPVLLAQPEDALGAIRGSIMANAMLAPMRIEARALTSDIQELVGLRKSIEAQQAALETALAKLGEERTRIDLLVAARQRQQEAASADLAREREAAQRLASEAGSLSQLVASLDRRRIAMENASKNPPVVNASVSGAAGRAIEEHAVRGIPFGRSRGLVSRPVSGHVKLDYGQADEFGTVSNGVVFVTSAAARVVAPADGRIVYSGVYRSYGPMMILDVGDGYHIVLAGLGRIDVEIGQRVAAGEPIAVMGNASDKARLYVEFRNDGVTVDPQPWWDRRMAGKGHE